MGASGDALARASPASAFALALAAGATHALTGPDHVAGVLAVTATEMESGYDPQSWRVSSVDAASGALALISFIDVPNSSMWFHGGCGYTAGSGTLFLFLAGKVDKSRRVLARVKLATAAVDHVPLDTSFSPAAAGGYQGPEWAAPAVAA